MKKIFTLVASTLLIANVFGGNISGNINLKNIAAKVPAAKFKTSFVSRPSASKDISILPDGSSANAAAKFTTKKTALALVKVYDQTGKIAAQEVCLKSSGTSNISISNITTLTDGTYTIVVDVNKMSFNTQLMIWK
ncbi:MAG: hypothetical protein WAT19_07095 [Ferruginibacter sp.]